MIQTSDKRRVQGASFARLAALLAVLTLGLQSPLVAAAASGLSDTVHRCAQEPDDAKRLACYDAAAGRTQPPASANQLTAAAPAPQKASEISASITRLARRADGRYLITLDNGQIWLEAETKERFSANTGDTVTIRSELLGAHYLRTRLGADVRVLRQP